jgi:hypothetical protein
MATKLRNVTIVAVLVVAILLGAYFGGGFLFAAAPLALPVNTATQTHPQFNWQAGSGACGGGQNPPVSGENLGATRGWDWEDNGFGEIFSQDKFYISWNSVGGVSESVNVAATIFACDKGDWSPLFENPKSVYRYQLTINNGNGFVPFINPSVPPDAFQSSTGLTWSALAGNVLPLQGFNFKINGYSFTNPSGEQEDIKDGAILQVDILITKNTGEWVSAGTDQTVLRSGLASVQWGATQYQVGQTASVSWQVPVTSLGGGTNNAYTLSIIDTNTGNALSEYDYRPITSTFGKASFVVTNSMFALGSSNRLRAIVSSAILNADIKDTTTIDDANLAPLVTDVTFNQALYHEGDSVVISYAASPNPTTESPIVKYHVLAQIAGAIMYDQDTSDTTVSFVAGSTGFLVVQVTAYDSAGRPSGVYTVTETVGNPVDMCKVFPNAPDCGGGGRGGGGVFWWVWTMTAAIVSFIAGALLIYFRRYAWGTIAILVGVILTIVTLILAGVF